MKTKLLAAMLLCVSIAWSAFSQTQFWGTAMSGGATNQGTIFRADANGGNFQIAYSFVNATGAMPMGGVTLANNGNLYGVTELGGFGDSCVVYCYEPGTGNYTNIHDFFQNTQLGYNAISRMTNTVSGMLYGLTAGGGNWSGGVIYEINPATNAYTPVYHFDGNTDGSSPMGSLIQLNNGKLYGMTTYGGQNGFGTIFNYDPFNMAYTKMHDFSSATGGSPMRASLMKATNGMLYGVTSAGGAYGLGVIFSIDPATSAYNDLFDFDGALGQGAECALVQAANGKLYGTTSTGGANNGGVLFSFDISTNTYTNLFAFNYGSALTGFNPVRGVTEGSNGILYGTTEHGGTMQMGIAFKYNISTGQFNKLVDFDDATLGSNPDCQLLETPILTPTGIASINPSAESSVYPNPATNSLTVRGTGKEDVIEFSDLAGKELMSLTIPANNKSNVDISHFPSVFFMKRQNGEITKIVRE